MKNINWTTSAWLIGVHLLSLLALLPQFFSWSAVGVFFILYYITLCWGITIGFHRLLSHRSFSVPKWLERFFALCGTLSVQHGPITWVGLHRHHHLHSDELVDHHNSNKGFFWSHMGWMFYKVPIEHEIPKFTKDLMKDPFYQWLEKYFLIPQFILGLTLYYFGGWSFVIWGVFFRLMACYHLTWLINSAVHKWGTRPFETGDNSTNNKWLALPTFGESWHNNHHMYQWSAKHGLFPGEFDLTWFHIDLLQYLGLAHDVKVSVLK